MVSRHVNHVGGGAGERKDKNVSDTHKEREGTMSDTSDYNTYCMSCGTLWSGDPPCPNCGESRTIDEWVSEVVASIPPLAKKRGGGDMNIIWIRSEE